ncbi:HdeD family acid-resistance protein [Nocardiopsis quinghaiensis]|uniref:HdeD family acid-resistance protein n=1 Tax=Nocardiopsis quinghaiensis TaxID=464995 RepID=UPI00123978E3|nr:HdeD family acid-resistance protein [Nocardiopsis quinghaiensis]
MVRYALAGDLLDELSRSWWLVVLRGVAAVLFGVVALVWPEKTLVVLAVVFGVYALADGAALGYAAYRAARGNRASLAVQAVIGVIMGLTALVWPVVAIVALVFVIGVWAVATGVAEIITAIRLRAHISSEWLLIFVGALSIVFGLLLWFWPLEGAQAIMFVIAMYAVVFGAAMAVAGFRLRGAADAFPGPEGGAFDDLRDPDEPAGGGSTRTYEELRGDGDREDGDETSGRGRHRTPGEDEGDPGHPDERR